MGWETCRNVVTASHVPTGFRSGPARQRGELSETSGECHRHAPRPPFADRDTPPTSFGRRLAQTRSAENGTTVAFMQKYKRAAGLSRKARRQKPCKLVRPRRVPQKHCLVPQPTTLVRNNLHLSAAHLPFVASTPQGTPCAQSLYWS